MARRPALLMSIDSASTVVEPSMLLGAVALIAGLHDLWAESTGDHLVAIAVLDGPVDRRHSSLRGANLTTLELATSAVPRSGGSATRHGTSVASLIFGRHGPESPVHGISPGCRGIIVPVFNDLIGGGQFKSEVDRPMDASCSQIDLARAILVAAEHGAHVINISGGQYAPTAAAHPILAAAVTQCARRGTLIVAAAGNDGCECLHVPAALPAVLAVGAMNARGEVLDSSNWGRSYRFSGLLAPGVNLRGARLGGGTSIVSGTSFATAVVSGVVGLLLSISLRRGLGVDAARIREILLDSADKCHDDAVQCRRQLAGRMNLARAFALLRNRDKSMSEEEPSSIPSSTNVRPASTVAAGPGDGVDRLSSIE
jgi:cyanobactin maturation PatA/PatG family protease